MDFEEPLVGGGWVGFLDRGPLERGGNSWEERRGRVDVGW